MTDTWKLVPVDPTDEMLEAGALAHHQSKCHDFEGPISEAWAAMLNAAPPTQPAQADEVEEARNLVPTLKAMVRNYSDGHRWDHLDAEAVEKAARLLAALTPRPAAPLATDARVMPARSHCQNGGDVCLAGNRDPRHVCCPEDSCDIDDGVRPNPLAAQPAAVEVQRPAPAEQPEREAVEADLRELERLSWRMGGLWEKYQGKGWPDDEGDLFVKLRDETVPALRAKLLDLTHPAATQAQPATADAEVRVPLTDERVYEIASEWAAEGKSDPACWEASLHFVVEFSCGVFVEGFRAAERAHGILPARSEEGEA